MAIAYTGVNAILGDDVNSSVALLNEFDESIKNIIATNVPGDEVWQAYLILSNV